jgi:hypothetical protein
MLQSRSEQANYQLHSKDYYTDEDSARHSGKGREKTVGEKVKKLEDNRLKKGKVVVEKEEEEGDRKEEGEREEKGKDDVIKEKEEDKVRQGQRRRTEEEEKEMEEDRKEEELIRKGKEEEEEEEKRMKQNGERGSVNKGEKDGSVKTKVKENDHNQVVDGTKTKDHNVVVQQQQQQQQPGTAPDPKLAATEKMMVERRARASRYCEKLKSEGLEADVHAYKSG